MTGATIPAGFDDVAAAYDSAFTDTQLGRWLRGFVWERLATHFRPGMRVLELGCGTGEDAVWLARHGVSVAATDASPAMLDIAVVKANAAGVADRIELQRVDLENDELPASGFDGAFSNFGALNCVSDLGSLGAGLARAVRPGGRVVLVIMGPWCLWEMAWYLGHGNVSTAFRRLRHCGRAAQIGSRRVRVWYHTPHHVRRVLAPWFAPRGLRAIGVVLPPSFMAPWVGRHSAVGGALRTAERHLAAVWPFSLLGDHYLIELERRSERVPVPRPPQWERLGEGPSSGLPA
jgi:ubiquinone/menaquinone biosynthesis C-methylase UbiE